MVVDFAVDKGEGLRSIANKLEEAKLIRSRIAFFLLTRMGPGKNIQAGYFRLSPSMNAATIAEHLTQGSSDVWVTTVEGWRNEEIALKLVQELENIPENEFLKVAKEGFMFPDTYLLPKDASASAVARIFLKNFDTKVTPDIRRTIEAKGLTLEEAITIASLVEREARFDADRPLVASVVLNRLRIGMKLDIDATVQFAIGYFAPEKTWWKKNLTIEDIAIDSPYNTYKNNGLPPTPIANPGLAVIKAVAEAPKTDYLYYISDSTGAMHFAKTIEEHDANIKKYLNR